MFLIPRKNSNCSKTGTLVPFGFGPIDPLIDAMLRQALLGGGLASGAGADWHPTLDIKEEKKQYVVTAELPGVEPDKLNVTATAHQLVIEAERTCQSDPTQTEGAYLHRERSYGSTRRVLNLPDDIDEGKVNADYNQGVLTVTLPKKQGSGGRKINVRQS